jgi:hypothetical protein
MMPHMTQTARQDKWVGIAEAAEAAGVSPQTIRNWITSGTLSTRSGRGPRGARTEVNVSDLPSDGARPARGRAAGGRGRAAKSTRKSTARKTAKKTTRKATTRKSSARKSAAGRTRGRAAATPAVSVSPAAPSLEPRLDDLRDQIITLATRLDQLEGRVSSLSSQVSATPQRRRWFGGS